MSTPTTSALARTYSALRAFLRHTWISRVNLSDWLKGWALGHSERRRQSGQKPKNGKAAPGPPESLAGHGGRPRTIGQT
jgi:hypothetical protein